MVTKATSLDAIDLKILQYLQKDARISNSRLAELVGLSQSACFQRVRRLEEQHYIISYNASIAATKICEDPITILTMVKLNSDQPHVVKEFETFVRNSPSILECHAILGEHDYLLRFLVANFDHYSQIVNTMMERDLKVRAYSTFVVTRSFSKPVEISSLLAAKSAKK
jgi:Lrp/AsnC family transcriptional regulator of ectoine degradation